MQFPRLSPYRTRLVPALTKLVLPVLTALLLAGVPQLSHAQDPGAPKKNIQEAMAGDGTISSPYRDFQEGRAQAALKNGKMLVFFQTDSCGYSKAFREMTAPDPEVARALDDLVIVMLDVEWAKDKFTARQHEVQATPTFVLYDEKGPLHQWRGWGKDLFLQNLRGALNGETLVLDRMKNFETAPTAVDGLLLGNFYASTGKFDQSLTAFRKAEELDPSLDLRSDRFDTAAAGFSNQQVSLEELMSTAEAITSRKPSAAEALNIASVVARASEKTDTPGAAAPFVATAFEKSESTTEPALLSIRKRLAPYHALYVDKDEQAALDLQAATLAANWKEDPEELNQLAWWCVIHRVHLDKAKAWAQQAIAGLSENEKKRERANARDTLAEIHLLQGNKDLAIAEWQQAMKDHPRLKAYRDKLVELGVKFDDENAKMGGK